MLCVDNWWYCAAVITGFLNRVIGTTAEMWAVISLAVLD